MSCKYECVKNHGLVSIIMPTYNCGRFIGETIRSVLEQTYNYWELIIVDDNSTDNTDAVVSSFADERIRYYHNEHNSGAAVTRNRALREAHGRWIAFLDSDDLWLPKKLERQIAFMVEKGYQFSYTCYWEIDSASHTTGVEIGGPEHITKFGMLAFCWPGCLTVMYNKETIGLVQIADIRKNNDYAMWLEVCRKSDCYLLNEVLAKYRRGRLGSISTHSYRTLIHWHYKLWHESEGMNALCAVFWTCVNLVCGIYKKFVFVKKI